MQTDFEQIESGTFIFDLFSRTRYLLPPVSADNRRPGDALKVPSLRRPGCHVGSVSGEQVECGIVEPSRDKQLKDWHFQ